MAAAEVIRQAIFAVPAVLAELTALDDLSTAQRSEHIVAADAYLECDPAFGDRELSDIDITPGPTVFLRTLVDALTMDALTMDDLGDGGGAAQAANPRPLHQGSSTPAV